MDPFIKKVRTQAEKDALIAEARRAWDEAGQFTHLLGGDEESYLAGIANAIQVESPAFVSPRPLSVVGKAELNNELARLSLFGGSYAPREYSSIPAIAELEKAQEREDFEKLVGTGVRARNEVESMIRQAIENALTKATVHGHSIPTREAPERQGILPRVAAATQGDNSDAARFIRAYVSNDRAVQREIVRELVADGA